MIKVISRAPVDCSQTAIDTFCAMVRSEGEVEGDGLEGRVRRAEKLVFLMDDETLIAVAALKNPADAYLRDVFGKAEANCDQDQFPHELGYIVVSESHRGQGHSRTLVEAALEGVRLGVIATSRISNERMHPGLRQHGFRVEGLPFRSDRGGEQLILFVRECTKGSHN